MASSDARPIPKKGVAYRATFPLLDADGDLVTGAADLDSEVSKDGAAFANCDNEATEIAAASGMYYLDLTATEMDADTVAVIVKTSTAGAKTTPLVLYPEEAGDIRVDVTEWRGSQPAVLVGTQVQARAASMGTNVIGATQITAAMRALLAYEIHSYTTAEAEGIATPDFETLYGVISALTHKHERNAADTAIIVYKSDGSTPLVTIPITKEPNLQPIRVMTPP